MPSKIGSRILSRHKTGSRISHTVSRLKCSKHRKRHKAGAPTLRTVYPDKRSLYHKRMCQSLGLRRRCRRRSIC